jgi:hypothetical protein
MLREALLIKSRRFLNIPGILSSEDFRIAEYDRLLREARMEEFRSVYVDAEGMLDQEHSRRYSFSSKRGVVSHKAAKRRSSSATKGYFANDSGSDNSHQQLREGGLGGDRNKRKRAHGSTKSDFVAKKPKLIQSRKRRAGVNAADHPIEQV